MVQAQQAVYLAIIAALPVLALLPGARGLVARHPRQVLLALLAADFCYLLWATVPFVPLGVDETFYAINAHVYRGSDLFLMWNRPPLTSLGAALCPWHPPLPGLLLRALSVWLAYTLAVRALGNPWALAAALLALASSRLTEHSAGLLSEPYGAAGLTAFAVVAVRGAGAASGLAGAAAFLARWPLGWLLPVAVFVGQRRHRWRGALAALALFAVPAALVVAVTHTAPWRMLADRGEWKRPVLETLRYYSRPDVGYGVGWPVLVLVVLGAVRAQAKELRWCVFLFAAGAGVLTLMGEPAARFMAPAAPIAAVVAAAGLQRLAAFGTRALAPGGPVTTAPRQRQALAFGVLTGLVAAVSAVPVRPPRLHAQRLASRAHAVLQDRRELLARIGQAPLYTDYNFIALTAVLDHRCHAVLAPPDAGAAAADRYHPPGVGLDLDGSTPASARDRLPPGAMVLTYDPGAREVLWRTADLCLVRW